MVFSTNFLRVLGLLLIVLCLHACGSGTSPQRGELVGVSGRKGWRMYVPYGMVYVPPGTFIMGQSDEDIANTQISFNKQVTVGGFFLDQTEITNNEYRQFTDAVVNNNDVNFEGTDSEIPVPRGYTCLLYTSPSPRDRQKSRMPSSA